MPVLWNDVFAFLLLVAKYITIHHNSLPVFTSAISMIFPHVFQKLSKLFKNLIPLIFLDVNECQVIIGGVISKGGCQHKCTNTIGSYIYSCNKGYYLTNDKKTCEGK